MKNDANKKLYHYYSVINLSNGLIQLNNSNSHNPIKELMLEYFNLMIESNYLVSQKESLLYYKKYILPIGQHLIEQSAYRTKGDIFKYIIVGIVIDFLVFSFLKNYYFIATPVLSFIGYVKKKRRMKTEKYFSVFW